MNISKDELKLQKELDTIEKINESYHEYDSSKDIIWQQVTKQIKQKEKKHTKSRRIKAACLLLIILCIPTSIMAAKKLPIFNDFISSDKHNLQKKYGTEKSSVATVGDYRVRIESSFISKDNTEGTLLLSFVPKVKNAPTFSHLTSGSRASDNTYQSFGVYASYTTKKGKKKTIAATDLSTVGSSQSKKKEYISIKYNFQDVLKGKKNVKVYCTLFHTVTKKINIDTNGDGKTDDFSEKTTRKEHGRIYLPKGKGYPIYEIKSGDNTLRITPIEITVTGDFTAPIGENPENYVIYYKNGKKKTLDKFTIEGTSYSYSDPNGESLRNTYTFEIGDILDASTIDRIKLDTTTFSFSKKKNISKK